MIKTHKIALRPNRDQIAWFYQQCGYAMFAYNAALFDFKSDIKQSMYDLNKRFNAKKKAYDWTKAQDQQPLKRYERKLKREQRKFSRKVFLSENWYKQKRIVERIHYRIACIRRDAHHKATTDIASKASRVGIETLQVTNLLKNRKLSKALSDAALGGFLEKLKTKAETLGIPIVQGDRFFASSKTCSTCGHKKADLTLSDREYQCSNCGVSIDRDLNAAINLKHVAAGYTET